MTVRDGWPPFEVWQANLPAVRRARVGRQFDELMVSFTAALPALAEALRELHDAAVEALAPLVEFGDRLAASEEP